MTVFLDVLIVRPNHQFPLALDPLGLPQSRVPIWRVMGPRDGAHATVFASLLFVPTASENGITVVGR